LTRDIRILNENRKIDIGKIGTAPIFLMNSVGSDTKTGGLKIE